MVKTKYTAIEIREIGKALAETLIANRIIVDKIILYGSYAKGTPRDYSDIDVAIISPSFKGKKIIERQAELAKILSKYLSVVEPIGYSSEDLQSAESETLLGEIRRYGKILYKGAIK